MTAQVGDGFEYNGKNYNYVMEKPSIAFHPGEYGITPMYTCTACWAGYWCDYKVSDNKLLLKDLFVNSMDGNYPDIEGVSVMDEEKGGFAMGHHVYRNINKPMKYTGKLLLGNDFLSEYYVHMGYQGYWAYSELILFVFEEGLLVEARDVSKLAAMKRRQIQEEHKSFLDRPRRGDCFGFTEDEYKYFCKKGENEFFKENFDRNADKFSANVFWL